MRDAAYRLLQDAWSAWLARRLRDDFARVERFCLFLGYPRSGHSIVGTMLEAHPDAVIAHELNAPPLILGGIGRDRLYARIVARARWFHLRGSRTNYDYRVPGQWQGRFRTLRVIGDKRGGAVTRALGEHPDLLQRTRTLTGVPLRLIHVVRDPLDNVAAIARWHGMTLADAADYYFAHCATLERCSALWSYDELITVRHEDFVRDPEGTLRALCAFLGLAPEPGWLASCRSVVFPEPTRSGRRTAWPDGLADAVVERARRYAHLASYAEADAGGSMRTKLG
ncbi:sulfotransferase [Candidatus Binatia bacterium]|nr:sulfotransferase [Candidatus Binatia bacterium]